MKEIKQLEKLTGKKISLKEYKPQSFKQSNLPDPKKKFIIYDNEEPTNIFAKGTIEELKDWWWKQLENGGYKSYVDVNFKIEISRSWRL